MLLKCGKYFVDWLTRNTDNDKVEVIAFHLYPEMLRKIYAHELPRSIQQRFMAQRIESIVPDDTIGLFIENLQFYFENPGLVNDDLLELKIKELILLLVQSKNADSVLQLLEELFTQRVANLREVVDTHLYSDLTLEELAELCNLSLSSFKREFEKVFSESPGRYILGRKLQKAAELLKISDHSIGDVAYASGFSDSAYFARCFKAKYNQAPSAYRKSSQ